MAWSACWTCHECRCSVDCVPGFFYYGEVQLLWDFNTLWSRQLLQCILWLKTIISYSKCHWIVMLNVSLNTSSLTMEWRIYCTKPLIWYSINCHNDQRLWQRKFFWWAFRECVISQNYIHPKTVISWPWRAPPFYFYVSALNVTCRAPPVQTTSIQTSLSSRLLRDMTFIRKVISNSYMAES